MKRYFKAFLLLLVFTVCISFMVACGSSGTNTPPVETPNQQPTNEPVAEVPVEKKPLRVGIEAEPTSLDPFNSTDGNSATVQSTMFQGLLDFDTDMNIVKVLAEDYSFNDDASAITFILKQGVTFHDGSDFNAHVVKENFEFVRNRDNGMARASFFSFIDEIIIEDDYKLTIKGKESNSAMASYLAHSSASIKSLLEIEKKIADPNYNLDRNPVGTGPFQFVEWRDSQHVLVEPFDNYWDEQNKAKVSEIRFIPVIEAATRVNMLKAGEIDIVFPIPTLTADELDQDQEIDVYAGSSMDVFYVGMNVSLDKYKDLNVRQAMNHAVNKDSLIALVLDGYGRVADSAIAPAVYGYAGQPIYEYDPALAKQLLAEAGVADGFKATLWTRNTTEFVTVAENVAMQLGAVGIDVEVQPYESGTLFDMLDAGVGTDLFIGRWTPGTGEADYGLRPNFASDRIPPNFNNSGFYINHDLDKLFDEALRTPDQQAGLALYKEIQEMIYQDAPWIFLYTPDRLVAKRTELQGITVRASGAVNLNGAYKN